MSRAFCEMAPERRKMVEGYHKTYKHDPKVGMILRGDNSQVLNSLARDRFRSLVKSTTDGLLRNKGRSSTYQLDKTEDFMKMISETLNGQTFTLFLRHLNEFKATSKREDEV